jgi:hypothetical protein
MDGCDMDLGDFGRAKSVQCRLGKNDTPFTFSWPLTVTAFVYEHHCLVSGVALVVTMAIIRPAMHSV